MRVIVVDDEELALQQFRMEAEPLPGVEIAGSFMQPEEALEYIE